MLYRFEKMLMGLSVSTIALTFAACSGPANGPVPTLPAAEMSEKAAAEAGPPSLEALSKDLSIQQTELAAVPSAPPVNARDLSLVLTLDRPTGQYSVGENVRMSARPNKDAYLWVVNVHDDGKMEMLFPNKYSPDNLVRANTEVPLPAEGSSYSFTVGGEPGADLVQAYATLTPEPPLPHMSKGTAAYSRGLGTFDIDAQALAKDLSMVVEKVNCAVSKDLSITSAAATPAAPVSTDASATSVSIEELCGAPPSLIANVGGQFAEDKSNWRDFGFASASAVFHIIN